MPVSEFYLQRLQAQLLREIQSTILNDVRDPRIPPVITITEVKLGDDTRNATVFISVFGDEELPKKEAVDALNHAAPFIQKHVARHVTMKNFPKLYFKLDRAFQQGMRIEELLKQVKNDLD